MASEQAASVIPPEAYEIHNNMVYHLGTHIDENQFHQLKMLFRNIPLYPVDLARIQNINSLCDCLLNYQAICVGNYKALISKLEYVNPRMARYVTNEERKIVEIINGGPSSAKKPQTADQEQRRSTDESKIKMIVMSDMEKDPSVSGPTEYESKLRMRVISDMEKDPSGSEPTEDESKLRMRLISDMEKDPSGSEPTEDESKLRMRLISDMEKDPSGSEPTEDESKLRMRLISDMEKDPSGSEPTEDESKLRMRVISDKEKDPSGSEPTEGLPVVIITQNFYTVTSGQTVVLECTVHASPTHTNVVWQRIDNGVATILTIDGNKYSGSSVNKPSLTITGANSNDNTVYTCSATNAVGTGTSGQTSLTVTEKCGVVSMDQSTYHAEEGSPAFLECTVDPVPDAIIWIRDNTRISIDNRKFFGGDNSYPTLVIKKAKKKDEGHYQCEAIFNTTRVSGDIVQLKVYESKLRMRVISDKEKDPSGSEPTEGLPVVIITQNFYTVTSGQTVVLECTVHASPTHTNVVWQRIDNGVATILTIDGNKYSGSSVNKPSLTITGANSNDNTVYTCSATNAVGTGTSGQTSLTVTENVHEKESTYKQSMKKKTQTQTIKLTFIGHARAGKTCLMRQLLRKHIKSGGPDPTNLANLLTKRLRYQLGKGSKIRETIKKGEEAELCRQRLRMLRKSCADKQIAREKQGKDPSSVDSSDDVGHDGEENPDHLEEGREGPVVNERMTPLTEDQRKAVEYINMEDDTIDDSSVAYVTLFDFGGDKVFYNCHHCIMSANSIYMLVFDVSLWEKPGGQDRIVDELVYWLNSVATHAKDETDKREGRPPIILIGSHMDKVTTAEDDIREQIHEKLNEKPGIKYIFDHHVEDIFFIDHMNDSEKNEETYLKIWMATESCADKQSCWQDDIAGSWLQLEEKVMLEKEKRTKFLNIQQILDLNGKLWIPVDEQELVPFLRYLHNAASIFCFDIIKKKDSEFLTEQEKQHMNAILDPSWIVNAFGDIITDDKFVKEKLIHHKDKQIWKTYKENAKLTNKVLNLRWTEIAVKDRPVLLSVMENLGLITEPMNAPHQTYIVPCLLDEAKSGCIQHILNDDCVLFTKTLCLIFENQFVPQAIWDKTVAICMHTFSPCNYQEKGIKRRKLDYPSPKRDFICLAVDGIWNFVLHCKGAMLKLTMFNQHKHPVIHGIGEHLRLQIEGIIKDILSMTSHGHRVFNFDYLHCDFWIADQESAFGKPNKETLMKCTDHPYRLQDTSGNVSFLTLDDYQAWFGDANKTQISAEEKSTKESKIHADMVTDLAGIICPGLKEKQWERFQLQLEAYLTKADVYGVDGDSMYKVCGCLMRHGKIYYGKYGNLRDMVKGIDVAAVRIIDDAMLKLNAL